MATPREFSDVQVEGPRHSRVLPAAASALLTRLHSVDLVDQERGEKDDLASAGVQMVLVVEGRLWLEVVARSYGDM